MQPELPIGKLADCEPPAVVLTNTTETSRSLFPVIFVATVKCAATPCVTGASLRVTVEFWTSAATARTVTATSARLASTEMAARRVRVPLKVDIYRYS